MSTDDPTATSIDITADGEHAYRVTLDGRDHRVTVPEKFGRSLGLTAAEEPLLVRRTIEYLLEREDPAAILPEFGLDEVGRYFPDYPVDIAARLAP